MWNGVIAVAAASVIAGLTIKASEQPVVPVTLGSGDYDIVPVTAPVASGFLLDILGGILCSDWLGQIIGRVLLNGNGLHEVRSLGEQAKERAVHVPIVHLSQEEMSSHTAESETAMEILLQAVERRQGDPRRGVIELHKAYQSGEWTPSQETERSLEAARTLGMSLKCFVQVLEESALAEAKQSTERWKSGKQLGVFDGIPFVVKDEVAVGGTVLGEGLHRKGRAPSEEDDMIISRLRAAGGVLIGKTVMTSLGMDPLGYNALFQGPFNPYNGSHFSGGSSAGTAVAVATGIVPVGLGLDGGGSIRIPSAFSGVYGLAPTTTRVPFSTGSTLLSVLKIGPLAVDVASAAAVYHIIAQPAPGHVYSEMYGYVGPPPPHFRSMLNYQSLEGVRLGVFTPHFEDATPAVVAACKHAVQTLEAAGATVVEVKIPHLKALALAHGLTIGSEIGASHETDWWRNRKLFKSDARISLGLFRSFSAKEYVAAMRLKGWALKWMREEVFSKVDVYVSPVAGMTAPPLPSEALASGLSNTPMVMKVMRYIFLSNFLGNPAISVPLGYEAETSLPLAFHMMASHWDEAILFRLAYALQVSSEFGPWKAPIAMDPAAR